MPGVEGGGSGEACALGLVGASDTAPACPGIPPSLPSPARGEGETCDAVGERADRAPAHRPVSPRQRSNAKRLRRELTPAERRLWHALRAYRFAHLHFRRQAPLGPYIVDFVCHAAKLVIEIDGGQHGHTTQQAADRERDAWLATQGYHALRFWNHDVLRHPAAVLDTVFAHAHPSPEGQIA